MSWKEFLAALMSPTVQVAWGVLFSYLADLAPEFNRWYNDVLSPQGKRLVAFLSCVAIAWTAATLYWFSGYVQIDSFRAAWEGLYWPALVSAGVGFGSSQIAHARKLSTTSSRMLGDEGG